MKRILSVILTLCLLCAVPFAHGDVDYAADYEAALTLAMNDLTNVRGLEAAIDMLQQLGGYQLARNYVMYFQALVDILSPESSFDTARRRIGTCARNAVFVEDLAVRRLPSCGEIETYIGTREMEAAGDRGSAYEAFAAMSILDAPDRAFNLLTEIAEDSYTVTVIHQDEAGTILDRETVPITLGGEITARARSDFEGYALVPGSAESVTVTADELGRLSRAEVVFTYGRLPDTVSLTVVYQTESGDELGHETVKVVRGGSLTVEAKTFDGYVLASGTPESVQISADSTGSLSRAEVVFTYKTLSDYTEITVECKDEDGAQLSIDTVLVDRGTFRIIRAKSIDGYQLRSVPSVEVKVDSRGKASKTQVVFTYRRITPKVSVGDYVTFGHYPQTEAGNDNTPIEWLVLDVQDGKALLLSRYGLDAKPYNKDYKDVTWENCTLREWLNGEFIAKAFSAQERAGIRLTDVYNSMEKNWDADGGGNTRDRIFLLSSSEVSKYLHETPTSAKSARRTSPTAFARKNHAQTSSSNTADGEYTGRWWLRSPGFNNRYAMDVNYDGSFSYSSVTYCGTVRPALWVNLDADIF